MEGRFLSIPVSIVKGVLRNVPVTQAEMEPSPVSASGRVARGQDSPPLTCSGLSEGGLHHILETLFSSISATALGLLVPLIRGSPSCVAVRTGGRSLAGVGGPPGAAGRASSLLVPTCRLSPAPAPSTLCLSEGG